MSQQLYRFRHSSDLPVIEPLERRDLWCGYHNLANASQAALASASSSPEAAMTATPRVVGAGTWSGGPQSPIAIGEAAAGVIGNKLYVVAQSTNRTLTFDFSTNRWSTMAAAPRLIAGDHHAVEVLNGKLYIIGGLTEYKGTTAPAGRVQIYNPSTNKWTFGANLPWSGGSVSTAVINGQIYAAGGVIGSKPGAHAGTGSTNLFARYNPALNNWTLLPPMPKGVNHAAAGTDGKRFFVFGGRGGANYLTNGFNTVQMFDPSQQRWFSSDTNPGIIKPLPVARAGTGKAVFSNGEFFLFGGETLNGPGATPNRVYNRVDIYKPVGNTWRQGANMPTAVHGTYPVKWSDKIYLPGGGTIAGFSQSKLFQIYRSG